MENKDLRMVDAGYSVTCFGCISPAEKWRGKRGQLKYSKLPFEIVEEEAYGTKVRVRVGNVVSDWITEKEMLDAAKEVPK